jgi:CDP-diacylglycerol--serine O-phosphatidyltransferase
MVTFGVVPGLILLHYLADSIPHTISGLTSFFNHPLLLIPLLIPVFSALRLAKFNVDTRQSESFRGLPTPASALWVIAIPLIIEYSPIGLRGDIGTVHKVIVDQWFIIASSIVLSGLMVSDIPLMAMKFKSFGWKGNQVKYAFLIISVLLLIILQPIAIPIILSLYVFISTLNNLFSKQNEI